MNLTVSKHVQAHDRTAFVLCAAWGSGPWQGPGLCWSCGAAAGAWPSGAGRRNHSRLPVLLELLLHQLCWKALLLPWEMQEECSVLVCVLPPWSISALRTSLQPWPVSWSSLLCLLHSDNSGASFCSSRVRGDMLGEGKECHLLVLPAAVPVYF